MVVEASTQENRPRTKEVSQIVDQIIEAVDLVETHRKVEDRQESSKTILGGSVEIGLQDRKVAEDSEVVVEVLEEQVHPKSGEGQ